MYCKDALSCHDLLETNLKKKDVPTIMIPRSLHFINGITKEWKAMIISWYSGNGYQFLPCYSQVQLIKIVRCWFYRGDLNPHRHWDSTKLWPSGCFTKPTILVLSREPSTWSACQARIYGAEGMLLFVVAGENRWGEGILVQGITDASVTAQSAGFFLEGTDN